ncbi:hypothetical protein M0R45_030893 [Rubus argutus]|uniref:Uncharacterized protein n=1 Tax=Rubus argutus TaxID=59490 RepID=A0AAW1WEK9_RUBAR
MCQAATSLLHAVTAYAAPPSSPHHYLQLTITPTSSPSTSTVDFPSFVSISRLGSISRIQPILSGSLSLLLFG